MTLNQVIKRIKTIALAHLQIKRCEYGIIEDILTDKKDQYALLWVMDTGAAIYNAGNTNTYNFRFVFLDLVNVASDTEGNQLDVQSDMFSVAKDIFAQINDSRYSDWKIDGISPGRIVYMDENDVVSGVEFDVAIATIYEQDICAVPVIPGINTTIDFGWFESDPYSDIEEAEFLYNIEVQPLSADYTLNFTSDGDNKFLAIKEPSTETEKGNWYNTVFNYGTFPDQAFRSPVIIAGNRYYVSRKKIVLQSGNYNITLS